MKAQDYIDRLYDDESLRSHMDDAIGAIYFHAASEYLREMDRRGADMEKAFIVARFGLRAVNVAIGENETIAAEPITIQEELDRR